MNKRLGLMLAAVMLILTTSCAGMNAPPPQGAPDATLETGKAQRVETLKKTIIATHEGLYVPLMTTLGALYDAGNATVRANEALIQTASEQYVKLKGDAAAAITIYGGAADDRVATILKMMLDRITELQLFRAGAIASTGGAP